MSRLEVFARAITPPYRHKRFDTWFFVQEYKGRPDRISDTHELEDVGWYDQKTLAKLEKHQMTAMMLSELQQFIRYKTQPATIAYRHMRYGRFVTETFPPPG